MLRNWNYLEEKRIDNKRSKREISMVFLHGLGQNSLIWKETINELDENLNIDHPDLFQLCDNEINFNNMYKALDKYLKKYIEPINICGLSLGGMLALNYTINNPTKVKSLALIGTQYCIPKYLMKFQNVIFSIMPQKAFKEMGLTKNDILSLTKSMINLNFEKDLGKINCPVLIICGEKDRANMKAAIQLSKILANSEYKVIPKSGHEVNRDNPQMLGKVLKQFLY